MNRTEREGLNRLLRELAEESRKDALSERLELLRHEADRRRRQRLLAPANQPYFRRVA